MPERKNSGTNTSMMISVANTIEPCISRVASCTTCSVRVSVNGVSVWAWRSRRTMFSTTMMASSTSAPRAIASPPRVMVLMVAPSALSTRMALMMDSGRASRVMAVERSDSRKAKTMMTTSTAPSRKAASRLSMALLMKSA